MKKVFPATLLGAWLFASNGFAQVSCGGWHSLFSCYSGAAKSSGLNTNGQLGDGTITMRLSPVQVSGLTSGIAAVSAGRNHSLFLKSDSTVWAVGYNGFGQLGDGTTIEKHTPVQVNGLTGIVAICAARDYFSLFLKNDSTVWACGDNSGGQLGNGTTLNDSVPVQISGLTGIIAIAAGAAHSLFLKKDGTVWSCGFNGAGQLGIGNYIDKYTPVQITSLSGIIAIAAGAGHSLFLKSDGTVWACGLNVGGQLGDGTYNSSTIPVQVNIANIVSIGAGWNFSLFVKNDGTAWGVGSNGYGELGNGTMLDTTLPVQVSGLTNVIAVTGGQRHSLFVKSDGTVWSCGRNAEGQLGIGNQTEQHIPVQVSLPCSVLGVEEFEVSSFKFEVYPNPSSGKANVKISQFENLKMKNIEIYNVYGEKVYDNNHFQINSSSNFQIDLSSQPDGIYFVRVKTAEGVIAKKIVVAR